MEIRELVRWTASGLAAVLLIGPAGSAVWEFYRDAGLPSAIAALLHWLSAVSSQPWFAWVCGASIGLAVGLWADSLLKRLAPAIPRVRYWYSLDDAPELFATKEQIKSYVELERSQREARRSYDELQSAHSAAIDPNDPLKSLKSLQHLTEAQRHISHLNDRERFLRLELRDNMLDELRKETLVAKAYMNDDLSQEVLIPPAQWRVLKIEYGNIASCTGVSYKGIEIGQRITAQGAFGHAWERLSKATADLMRLRTHRPTRPRQPSSRLQ